MTVPTYNYGEEDAKNVPLSLLSTVILFVLNDIREDLEKLEDTGEILRKFDDLDELFRRYKGSNSIPESNFVQEIMQENDRCKEQIAELQTAQLLKNEEIAKCYETVHKLQHELMGRSTILAKANTTIQTLEAENKNLLAVIEELQQDDPTLTQP